MAAPKPGTPALEIMDLRHFTSADLRSLLDHESQHWGKMLAWDYRGSAEMILRYVDAKILPGYAAVSRNRVCGYSFFVYEGSKGVIGDLYVDENGGDRRSLALLEQRLLAHVIETLQHSPGIHRIEAQLLLHDTDQVARPFMDEGFRRFRRLFMVMPLDVAPEPPPLPPEFDLRRWSEADFNAAAAVITTSYRNHIDSEINDQYRSINGSMRFLNNIVRFPGCGVFDNESSLVAVHRASRTMVGVILCSRVKDDVGHVTQVCVLPEYRGRGIGEGLIAASARNLHQRGFSSLSLTVTEANTRAVEIYKRMSFDILRVFDAFVWED